MSRAGTRSETLPGGVPAAGSRADACIRAAAGVTVVGLAGNQETGRGRSRQPWQGRLPTPGRERILRPAPCYLSPEPPGTACSAGAIR
ncbi:MAG TPA: hypothetical protein VK586_08420 [Streptosporangiaceae bacterium]|nr:hypothetical protein [Streptosporangiaceae bacterium]